MTEIRLEQGLVGGIPFVVSDFPEAFFEALRRRFSLDGGGRMLVLWIKPTIQRKSRKPRRGRPIRVGEGYRRRWIIERCFGWMTNYRRLVVRYDRYLRIFRAFCLIAFIIWWVNRILK